MDALTLSTLVDATANLTTPEARQAAVRTALAGNQDIDLGGIEAQAVAEFDRLHAANDDAPGALNALRQHADVIHAVRAEQKARTGAPSGQSTATAPQLADAPATPASAPAAVQPPAESAPTAETTSPTPAPQEDNAMDTTTVAPTAAAPEAVAASAAPGTKVTLSPAEVVMPWENLPYDLRADGGSKYVITAAAGAAGVGVEAGEQFDDFAKLAKLMAAKFESLGRGMNDPSQMMLAAARPEDWANAYSQISRSSIASLGFERPHDFIMTHQHDWEVIERACNEARLPGGSLTPASVTAAGTPGWCAPCSVSYDFCPPAVVDGIVDLPTVIAPRGCLTFPSMPDFGQLYSQVGFCYPAADYDRDTPPPGTPEGGNWAKNKPCLPVPCPDQQTCTLDPCGICLQSSLLIERAYPELIQYFISNALVAWAHRMNCRDISQMIAKSTAVTVTPANTGPGATATVLESIEYYATWLRYKFRLGRNASIEAVLPDWLKGVLRADLSKRMGVDLLSVTDELIESYFRVRKVRIQWVLGLDEAFCDVDPASGNPRDPKTSVKFGGGTSATDPKPPATLWPTTASFLMYPASTFFRARMNLVNIEGGLVDSALLKRNERLLLFVEEASVVCKRCYDSLYITVPLCASGQTGGPGATPACGAAPAPAPAPGG